MLPSLVAVESENSAHEDVESGDIPISSLPLGKYVHKTKALSTNA